MHILHISYNATLLHPLPCNACSCSDQPLVILPTAADNLQMHLFPGTHLPQVSHLLQRHGGLLHIPVGDHHLQPAACDEAPGAGG